MRKTIILHHSSHFSNDFLRSITLLFHSQCYFFCQNLAYLIIFLYLCAKFGAEAVMGYGLSVTGVKFMI